MNPAKFDEASLREGKPPRTKNKNSIKLPLVRESRHEFDFAKHKVVVAVFDDRGARDRFCQTHTRRILVSRQNSMI